MKNVEVQIKPTDKFMEELLEISVDSINKLKENHANITPQRAAYDLVEIGMALLSATIEVENQEETIQAVNTILEIAENYLPISFIETMTTSVLPPSTESIH